MNLQVARYGARLFAGRLTRIVAAVAVAVGAAVVAVVAVAVVVVVATSVLTTAVYHYRRPC